MKGGTVQIAWHGSDPVLTLDFHRLSGLLATGGADHDIKLWTVQQEEAKAHPSATFEANLSYHTAAVNVLRFSPNGDQLASGADGGELLIWKCLESSEIANMWKVLKTLRFHHKDILDLEWSPDGMSLISGSVDNSVIIWDVAKGNPQQVLKDHMHYVQGVAWDPAGQFVASISGDRTCRIYSNRATSSKVKGHEKNVFSSFHVIVRADTQKQDNDSSVPKAGVKPHLFHDETLPSFFRRLSWSPDGSFLLVPSGIHKFSSESILSNTTYIISRKDLSRPALHLPGASKPVVAVRFCPILFALRPSVGQKHENDATGLNVFQLPYRLVFAVATTNSLYIYDTQNACPLAIFAGLHYASITDIAWSWDARFLGVSSQDGFCTMVAFEDGELGSPISLNDVPPHVASYLPQMTFATEKMHETKSQILDEKHPRHEREYCARTESKENSTTGMARLLDYAINQQEFEQSVSSVSGTSGIIVPLKCEMNKQEFEQAVPSVSDSLNSELKQHCSSRMPQQGSSQPLKPRRITPVAIPAENLHLSEG